LQGSTRSSPANPVLKTAYRIGEDNMNLDFKCLTVEQEVLLRKVLGHCNYLAASSKWNVGESVLRTMQENIANDYVMLERATAKVAPTKVLDAGTF